MVALGRRRQVAATVAANLPLCREHYRLVLKVDGFGPTEPGQFVQVAGRDLDEESGADREVDWEPGRPGAVSAERVLGQGALLRRPFSLAGRRDVAGGVELDLIHRVVGLATHWMADLTVGQTVHILGPLGNAFELPAEDEEAILVGGGVGIPPMIYLAEKLALRPRSLRRGSGQAGQAVVFAGATRGDLVPLTMARLPKPTREVRPELNAEEFARHGIPTVVCTDDGSAGFGGLVTEALQKYLKEALTPALSQGTGRGGGVGKRVIYTCGPEGMMKRVAQIGAAHGAQVQVSVERAMACGMGTCQSCCIRVRKAEPAKPPLAGSDWCYRLACTDGTVFRGDELLW